MNRALHAKWVWRYEKEKKALWRSIIHQKFGGHVDALVPNDCSKPVGKILWTGILKSKPIVQLSRNKHATVGEMMEFTEGNQAWNLNFSRVLKNDEVDMVANLLQLISNPHIAENGDDTIIWIPGNAFSVRSCYLALQDDGFLRFPYKSIWNPIIPMKVIFFAWYFCYNAAPTLDSIGKSIVINACILCKKAPETNTHLFLHREETGKLWNFFFNSFKTHWVFGIDVRTTMWEWCRKKRKSLKRRLYFCNLVDNVE
ncbi:uncharacterized protein LOC113279200 [Papaver somniferum]|uniref:uncharacterized protein LOC113279200 n=1 Tax=Papaver somniferum TaxID=3469 RepID=UPI000E6F9AA3|nr:uncharacterized protein LOC113279200 [Papaver somniferum]